jgi:hypothetical protein
MHNTYLYINKILNPINYGVNNGKCKDSDL